MKFTLFGLEFSLQKRASPDSKGVMTYGPVYAASTATGITVTQDSAMRLAAAYRAIWLKSNAVALLPIEHYRKANQGRSAGKKRPVVNSPLIRVLEEPNKEMNGFILVQTAHLHYHTRGNAFIQIVRNRRGDVTELWLLDPDRMNILRQGGQLIYRYYTLGAGAIDLLPEEVIHIKNISKDGIWGLTPAQVCAETIGYGLANQQYGANFYRSGARLDGVVSTDAVVEEEDFKKYQKDLNEKYTGLGQTSSIMFLDNGFKFQPVTLSQRDAQYIESAKFNIDDIGRLYGVPSYLLNQMDRATFNNVENLSILFVQYSILPELKMWTSELNRKLFTPEERAAGNFFEFQVDELLRGDVKSRYEAYGSARQWGWMSVNEIRARENLPPIPGGDQYLVPVNMTTTEGIQALVDKYKLDVLANAAMQNPDDPAQVVKDADEINDQSQAEDEAEDEEVMEE